MRPLPTSEPAKLQELVTQLVNSWLSDARGEEGGDRATLKAAFRTRGKSRCRRACCVPSRIIIHSLLGLSLAPLTLLLTSLSVVRGVLSCCLRCNRLVCVCVCVCCAADVGADEEARFENHRVEIGFQLCKELRMELQRELRNALLDEQYSDTNMLLGCWCATGSGDM